MTNPSSFFQAGAMPRNQFQINLTITGVQTDQWIDYLGPEVYCWWLKFHSWIDNSATKKYEKHIPYTLESVMEKLEVSQTTFYRKIKKMWECGLIEIAEFEFSERKAQKPKNIFVYSYPFNKAELQYKPLEKLRDWKKDYDSESKIAGVKGAFKRWEMDPTKSGRVEKSVDNSPVDNVDNYPTNFGRVTLPNLVAIQSLNNLINLINNHKDKDLVNKGVNKNQKNNSKNNLNQKQEYDPDMENITHTPKKEQKSDYDGTEPYGVFLVNVMNEFYTKFAYGRWNKKQWEFLVEKLGIEIVTNDEIEIYNHRGYIHNCLTNIAYRHDLKHGKIESRKPIEGLPLYDYWLDEIDKKE